MLFRSGRQSGTGPGVSALREAEKIRSLSRFVDCRIVIGQFGGLSSLAREAARAVRLLGADVVLVDEPDARAQADAANRFQAHAYLGLEASFDADASFFYYRVPSFSSPAGEALASTVARSAMGTRQLTKTSVLPSPVRSLLVPVAGFMAEGLQFGSVLTLTALTA